MLYYSPLLHATTADTESSFGAVRVDHRVAVCLAIMSDRAARELAALEGVLKSCNIAQPVKDYIIKTLGAASVSDFYGKVSEGAFEQEIVTLILDKVASAKDNPLQTSRLRAAWRAAKAIVCKTESHKK